MMPLRKGASERKKLEREKKEAEKWREYFRKENELYPNPPNRQSLSFWNEKLARIKDREKELDEE